MADEKSAIQKQTVVAVHGALSEAMKGDPRQDLVVNALPRLLREGWTVVSFHPTDKNMGYFVLAAPVTP
jgi:hypothetical protein